MLTLRAHCLALILLFAAPAAAIEVQFASDEQPQLQEQPEIITFSPKLLPLWLEAMRRPELDLKRQAADAISKAYTQGMRDVDAAVPVLVEQLQAENQRPVVLLAAAHALIAIDARSAAPLLRELAQTHGLDMAQLVEPALARWQYRPIREIWLARLSEPTPHALRILAIDCLAVVEQPQAREPLRRLALDPAAPADVRLHAARALGQIQQEKLLNYAETLTQDLRPERLVDRLVGASLLAQHRGSDVEQVLLKIAIDPQPAVAAIALERLLQLDPKLVQPINERLVRSPDSKIRRLATQLLLGQHSAEAVAKLGDLLDDPHPAIRAGAREALLELAQDAQLDPAVRQAGMKVLETDERIHGVEQALILLGALDHKPAAPRALELLRARPPQVFITAGWTLRQLAVPETAAPMLERVKQQTQASLDRGAKKESIDATEFNNLCDQLHHLIEALGAIEYEPAEPLLRQYLPKPKLITNPLDIPQTTTREAGLRAGAIWSLGRLYAGEAEPELVKIFIERLSDDNLSDPEAGVVRQEAAEALARMEAADAAPVLRKFVKSDETPTDLGQTCAWALAQLTGEPIAEVKPRRVQQFGWFLEPLDP